MILRSTSRPTSQSLSVFERCISLCCRRLICLVEMDTCEYYVDYSKNHPECLESVLRRNCAEDAVKSHSAPASVFLCWFIRIVVAIHDLQ